MPRYLPESASQAGNGGPITIKAERHSDGSITSARLESYQLWTTNQDPSIRNRGYVEVRATLPAKVSLDVSLLKKSLSRSSFLRSVVVEITRARGQQSGCLVTGMEQVGLLMEKLTSSRW